MDIKALMAKVESSRQKKGSSSIPSPSGVILRFVKALDGNRRMTYKVGLHLFLEEGLISSLPGNTRTWGGVAKVFPTLLQYMFCRSSDHGYHEKAYFAWGEQLLAAHDGDDEVVANLLKTPVVSSTVEIVELFKAFKAAEALEAEAENSENASA